MRDLVGFALSVRELAGSTQAAIAWAAALASRGRVALHELGVRGDAVLMLEEHARRVGLLGPLDGADRVRAAQLVVVLDLLEAVPEPHPVPHQSAPLVFTVPPMVHDMIAPAQRLDLLIDDVIARSEHTLHIGGPFWNEGGWDALSRVVLPALSHRQVAVTFYLHKHESGTLGAVHAMLADAAASGSVRALWWAGGSPSLMHAKFVVADRCAGYLGCW